jgi:hypothetical protein
MRKARGQEEQHPSQISVSFRARRISAHGSDRSGRRWRRWAGAATCTVSKRRAKSRSASRRTSARRTSACGVASVRSSAAKAARGMGCFQGAEHKKPATDGPGGSVRHFWRVDYGNTGRPPPCQCFPCRSAGSTCKSPRLWSSSGCRRTIADRSRAMSSQRPASSRSWSRSGPCGNASARARQSAACRRNSEAFFIQPLSPRGGNAPPTRRGRQAGSA